MKQNNLPQHITITMDGDRRWAKQHGLTVSAGHKRTLDVQVEKLIEHCGTLGIPYITFWAWTTENWNRPKLEVKAMMNLFRWAIKNKATKFIERGARLNVIGDLSNFPQDIQDGIHQLVQESAQNRDITVTFGLNYGGRDEIIRAIKSFAQSGNNLEDFTPEMFAEHLDTHGLPDPDLMIRPGGRKRLSGLLPWQGVYAELYFTDVLMPDFGPEELDKAIKDYQNRKRTFGAGSFEKL